MRVILATLGSFGDINPFIWMGRVLRSSGNEVIFIANPYFEEMIKKEAFDFYPAGTLEDYNQATIPAVRTGSRFRDQGEAIQASRRLFNCMFMKPAMEIYNIIYELKNQETLILNHFYAYGAKLAAEKHSIPSWNVCLSPYWLKAFRRITSFPAFMEGKMMKGTNKFIDGQLFTKPMNKNRAEIGLPSLEKSSIEWMFEGDNLCLFPDWFIGYQLIGSLNVDYIGFPDPSSDGKALSVEMAEFLKAHDKPVVFTPGSAFRDVGRFFEAAAVALEKLKKPGIFLTRHIEAIPKKLPDNIIHADFVPLEQVLGQCSALVHHGGVGTCYQAIKAGIPQVVCWRMGEQKENARVPKEMGICRTIAYKDVSGEAMYQNIKALLNDAEVQVKCDKVSERVNSRSSEDTLRTLLSR